MKHKNSHLLVGYWSRLRKGRAVPDQTDVDPRAVKRMLPHIFILDAEKASRPVYRLAGTALCERFGLELRGTGFLGHWEQQSHLALSSLVRQAQTLKLPLCLSSVGATSDSAMIELETVIAPISFGGQSPVRFIGMVQSLADGGAFTRRTVAFQRLTGSEFVHEDRPLTMFDDLPPPPPAPTLRSHPRAPHLRLVVSQNKPQTLHFESENILETVFGLLGKSIAFAENELA